MNGYGKYPIGTLYRDSCGLLDSWGSSFGPDDWQEGDVNTYFEPVAAAYAMYLDERLDQLKAMGVEPVAVED